MFGVDWSEAETLWLNLTNLGLGLVVIACIGVVAYGVIGDLKERGRFKARVRGVDRDMEKLAAGAYGPHALETPELGLLLADGGEPVGEPRAEKKNSPKRSRSRKSTAS